MTCAAASIRCVVAASVYPGERSKTAGFSRASCEPITCPSRNARYFVASLVRPGDALCQPILPDLWEPILIYAGNSVLILRGFERAGDDPDAAATVQELQCEVMQSEHRGGPEGL